MGLLPLPRMAITGAKKVYRWHGGTLAASRLNFGPIAGRRARPSAVSHCASALRPLVCVPFWPLHLEARISSGTTHERKAEGRSYVPLLTPPAANILAYSVFRLHLPSTLPVQKPDPD